MTASAKLIAETARLFTINGQASFNSGAISPDGFVLADDSLGGDTADTVTSLPMQRTTG
ncbi:MAG: hypothetical protein AAFX44_12340 [Pseudomonadota bacterium]